MFLSALYLYCQQLIGEKEGRDEMNGRCASLERSGGLQRWWGELKRGGSVWIGSG